MRPSSIRSVSANSIAVSSSCGFAAFAASRTAVNPASLRSSSSNTPANARRRARCADAINSGSSCWRAMASASSASWVRRVGSALGTRTDVSMLRMRTP